MNTPRLLSLTRRLAVVAHRPGFREATVKADAVRVSFTNSADLSAVLFRTTVKNE